MVRLLLLADGGKNWIGGLYYVRNILHDLLCADIDRQLRITILVSHENRQLFDAFAAFQNVQVLAVSQEVLDGSSKVRQLLSGHNTNSYLARLVADQRIDWVFPVTGRVYATFEEKCIHWIPDFQYMYYPQYSSYPARFWRKSLARAIARTGRPIVLSSESARSDYMKYFNPKEKKQIAVVPFTSYLDEYHPDPESIRSTTRRYRIEGEYFICANQFWPHKNHRVILRALSLLYPTRPDIQVVFTGSYRGAEGRRLLREFNKYAADSGIEDQVKMLGFVDRTDQLDLMSASVAVIQPSLFEGWGTVFEDARALGKAIIISDIPVHKEQAEGRACFFDPDSPQELSGILCESMDRRGSPPGGLASVSNEDRAASYGARLLSHLQKGPWSSWASGES